MRVWKIAEKGCHEIYGFNLYSNGYENPKFNEEGTIWYSEESLKAHLRNFHKLRAAYKDSEVVEYELKEVKTTPVEEVFKIIDEETQERKEIKEFELYQQLKEKFKDREDDESMEDK